MEQNKMGRNEKTIFFISLFYIISCVFAWPVSMVESSFSKVVTFKTVNLPKKTPLRTFQKVSEQLFLRTPQNDGFYYYSYFH